MSIRVMSWVWDTSPSEGRKLLVELALADFANDDGECWPSIPTIARKARCTDRWVQETIRELIAQKRLSIKPGKGPHGANVYVFLPVQPLHPEVSSPLVNGDATGGEVSDRGGEVSDRGGEVSLLENSPDPSYPSKEPLPKPSVEPDARARANIFVLYDNYMGRPSITPTMRTLLEEAEHEYAPECIEHCFVEAAASSDGRRSWAYVKRILERHAREGCEPKAKPAPAAAPVKSRRFTA